MRGFITGAYMQLTKYSPYLPHLSEWEGNLNMNERNQKQTLRSLLVTCPGIGEANPLVKETTAEALVDFLLNLTDVDDSVDDDWYYYLLREKVYVEEEASGNVGLWFGSEEERLSFIRDPRPQLIDFGEKVNGYIVSVCELNEPAINAMYSGYTIQSITVADVLNNHILLLVRGTQ